MMKNTYFSYLNILNHSCDHNEQVDIVQQYKESKLHKQTKEDGRTGARNLAR